MLIYRWFSQTCPLTTAGIPTSTIMQVRYNYKILVGQNLFLKLKLTHDASHIPDRGTQILKEPFAETLKHF